MLNSKKATVFTTAVYRVVQGIRQAYWTISGGRKENVFGEQFNFASSTHFPSFRGLRFPPGEIFSTIVRYGDYVQTHSAYLSLMEMNHPPVLVDIGAHHGAYAVLLGKLVQTKKGTIIAVEPNPEAFEILKENVRRNNLEDTVRCERAAVMEQSGAVRISNSGDQSRIIGSMDSSSFEVQATPLSRILKKHSLADVDIMIIDVEGAELNVLRSINWNECRFGRIFCELHPYNWKHFGYSGSDMKEFLRQHSFRCFDMYLREHVEFMNEAYIGPTFFVPDHDR